MLKKVPFDHSLTYQGKKFRNMGHALRLKAILRKIKKDIPVNLDSFADFGCSTGYVTNFVAAEIEAQSVFGFDRTVNIEIGMQKFPHITFQNFNLNEVQSPDRKYDLVTCFETLEHVGELEPALENLFLRKKEDGYVFISVPIEIGFVGLVKYFVKRFISNYELPLKCNDMQYFWALITKQDIAQYRLPADGYGSHFGFDYRKVDGWLKAKLKQPYLAYNSGATRFYFIAPHECFMA